MRAAIGASTRVMLRQRIELTRAALEPEEEVAAVALAGRTAGLGDYTAGTIVFASVFLVIFLLLGDDGAALWTALALAALLSLAVDVAVRRRRRTAMLSLALVTVTDRRLLQVGDGARVQEIPLAAVELVHMQKGIWPCHGSSRYMASSVPT